MPVEDADFQAAMDALIARVNVASRGIAVKGSAIIQRVGMKHTKVVSGTLRRSWRTQQVGGTGGVFAARVGPTTVYARRQELGFKGPDSLGRIFHHDPGWPYVKPAIEESTPMVGVLARASWAAALRG